MTERIEKLREQLRKQNLPAALIKQPENVAYLTGFTGSTAMLLVTGEAARFITDSRYATQAVEECPGVEVVLTERGGTYDDRVAQEVRSLAITRLGIEGDVVTVKMLRSLEEKLDGISLEPVNDLVSPLRLIKDEEEIACTRQSCAIADLAFQHVLTLIRPGAIEREIAAEMEFFMKKQGAEKEAFDTIVASGIRSALPHGRASDKAIEAGDFITFDFGCRLRGYHSDITRTIVVGKASDRQREVYGIVLDAQMAALEAIRPGRQCREIDATARDRIAAAGYGDNFGHSLGHGLGRTVHDSPGFHPRNEQLLEPGMILTVEPGIYIDGWGGVRIEDDIVVTGDGCEILTHSTKELLEV